jgi:Zn-dependent M28 family amino/carboxypeptidase
MTMLPDAATQRTARFDSARAWEDLRQIVSFGPRPPGSAALDQTRQYLRRQLTAAGIAVSDQAFEATTPLGPIRMVNLIGRIPGARGATGRLAIAGHYDTKLFRAFRFVGASDGGSSAAFLLEIGRALKARANPLPIELLFFDGEEALVEWIGDDNRYGSRHYVEAARKAGTLGSLRALILVDMIGDRRLNIRRETNSTPWLTDIIWGAARRLQHQAAFVDEAMPIEDDHVPFLQAGVPAVDLIDMDYAVWHTPADTLDAVSARSLQIVGDVVLEALPEIEQRVRGEK